MGLIFGVFDVVTEIDNETGKPKSIYKYTLQEGITVRRVEQLGVESRLINRLFEEQGREALRYKILKDAEAIQNQLFTRNCLAEMLVIFEYYYENIYNLQEIEISGDAKIKMETYEYTIAKNLAREIESKVQPNEREEFINRVLYLKNNLDAFSELCGDGMKRVLKIQQILMGKEKELDGNLIQEPAISNGNNEGMSLQRLKELKLALDDGLITEEEYNKAKQEFLKI